MKAIRRIQRAMRWKPFLIIMCIAHIVFDAQRAINSFSYECIECIKRILLLTHIK
jgi:hypothetical protein